MYNCVKRIQGVLWRHVDITVIDITQHGLKGLLTWNHLTNRDINLPVLRHEGAKHSLKVTGEQKYNVMSVKLKWTKCTDKEMKSPKMF